MTTLATQQDINAINSDAVFLTLLEIQIPNVPTVYLVGNNEDITWNGNTYIRFPFDLDDQSFTSKSETITWKLKVSNATRIMERYIQDYDLYLKQNGIEGNKILCFIRVVNSKDLINNTPILEHKAFLQNPKTDQNYAYFTLSPSNPGKMQFPFRRIIKNQCSWKFKGTQCAYVGEGQFCDKTLITCRGYNNSNRFGGFVGVGGRGVTLVR